MPTLREELLNGPLSSMTADYITGANNTNSNDELCARILNEKEISGRKRVLLSDVKKHALENGYWAAIRIASTSHQVDAVKFSALSAIDYVNDLRFESIDLDLPAVQSMLNALVSGSVITEQQRDSLLALGDVMISRAEQVWGIGTVITAADVGAAR